MNKKIASALVGILLIGIVSAGLVGYLSNMVSGSVEVSGPVFYLSCEDSGLSAKPYKLLINNDLTGQCKISFTDNYTNPWFVTDPLGVESFYPANYEIFLKIKNTDKNEIGQVLIELWVIKEDGDSKYPIDSELFFIDPKSTWENSVILTGEELTLDNTDRIALKLSDELHDITYEIVIKKGNNKIEVSAI
jgi:hypothetical protein